MEFIHSGKNKIMIEFIIPTYNRQYQLLTIIGSIISQNNSNWKIHVVADAIYEGYDDVKKTFSNIDKIRFSELNGPHNDWGHTPRQYGLSNATEEWIIMSGDDNYYTPNLVDTFLKNINSNTNFIYCDMLHNHDTGHTDSYKYFNSKPETNYIDIGNFATRTKFSKEINFNKGSYAADGEFVETYIKTFCKEPNNIKKIEKALYIHN
jgi:glycosyltransferase involved in cell wall biosynthesis